MNTQEIRIVIVDDQPLVRMGLRLLLDAHDGLHVVAEAGDGAEALEIVSLHEPDVVLMDVRMPRLDGIEATRRLVATHPRSRILVLTTFDHDEYAFGALRAGASGFLLKDAAPDDLVAAIRVIHSGDAVVSPRVTRRMLELFSGDLPRPHSPDDAALSSLTPREREVLQLVARGLSNTEITEKLFLSESTVKTHVGHILAKIGARDRVHAVIIAYEAGLV